MRVTHWLRWVRKKVGVMTYDVLGPGGLDYLPCRYGASKLLFRGPERRLKDPYVAFVGGTYTFGKFIEQPYSLKVEHLTGVTSVNFGQVNAGVDVFAKERIVHKAAIAARVTVVEVLGAVNMSSLLYSVHPRRNDRFLKARPPLRQLYPDVDFTQFHFTQHMLRYLHQRDPERFVPVRRILQRTWLRRMRQLLKKLGEKVVLIQFGEGNGSWPAGAGHGPLCVTNAMIDELRKNVSASLYVPVDLQLCNKGKVFHMPDEAAAKGVPGSDAHTTAAQALCPILDRLM